MAFSICRQGLPTRPAENRRSSPANLRPLQCRSSPPHQRPLRRSPSTSCNRPGQQRRWRDVQRAPLVRPAEARLPVLRLFLLSLATAMAVAAGAVAVVVLRSSDLCALVGLCPAPRESSGAVEALDAAEQATDDLGQADTLRAYERALEELEQQRQRLDQGARDARGVLADERKDALQLGTAGEALAAARQSSGDERAGQLAIARDELDAIAPRSISAAPARRLRRELEQLEAEAPPSELSEQEAVPDPTAGERPVAEPEAQPSSQRQHHLHRLLHLPRLVRQRQHPERRWMPRHNVLHGWQSAGTH